MDFNLLGTKKLWNLILKAASVNSNIVFMISGSAVLSELVTVTFTGIRSSNFFTRGYS